MRNLAKKCIPIICLVPLIFGTVGYLVSGEKLTNCLYASFALYFTNPISDEYNGFIEFARWTAPLVTATAILCAMKNVWKNIVWSLEGRSKDSVAVYTDEKLDICFDKGVKAAYLEDSFRKYFKSQLILFNSDNKSLQFYAENKEKLKHKAVYIGLRELEQGLLCNLDEVNFFDINGSISRTLWKKICLWSGGNEKVDIVIYGNGTLAQQILSTGLLLNLFSRIQHIKYHFITDNPSFQVRHQCLNLMNADEILYNRTDSDDVWRIIGEADIVILADCIDCEMFQNIVVTANGTVYYYSPEHGDIGDCIDFGCVVPFGRNEDVFTDDNIRRKKLIGKAIALNKEYAEKYKSEEDWNKLSGFFKASNISSADYLEVLSQLAESKENMELAELEHIRWCRFHYLNYWNYGKEKDIRKRLHTALAPFEQLKEAERAKTLEIVLMAKKKM